MSEKIFLLTMVSPFLWICFLGLCFFARIQLKEKLLSTLVKYFSLYMAMLAFILFVLTWLHSPGKLKLDYADWITVGHYNFKIRFIVDLLGSTYSLLTACLIGIIFRFSRNYLHKEEGYFRFIFLLSVLIFGLNIVSFARSLDLLFAGWELVGTTSVLLISYFYTKARPVKHALFAIITYRICDMGILAASAWSHHHLHSTDFYYMSKAMEHSHGGISLIFIGLFIIWASLGKAAQLPMCSWLPVAMEGPTPSSAIFYGALSVHLGPFLLIRSYDYLENFPGLLILIGCIGGLSALYASFVGRTRSDAKSVLGFATITQVGLIFVEISLGFTNFALFHMVVHASLRTWQFLRSSSVIQDFYENPMVLENVEIQRSLSVEKYVSSFWRRKIYIHALHSFHLDFYTRKVIFVICYPFKKYIQMEKAFMNWDNALLKKLLKKGSRS